MYSIRNHISFTGPNGWSQLPVTHAIVDAGPTAQTPRSLDWAARWTELSEDVHEGTSLAPIPQTGSMDVGAVLANLALNLQRVAGVPVAYCYGRPRTEDDGFDVVVQHQHAAVGLSAIRLALRWLADRTNGGDRSFDLAAAFGRFVIFLGSNDHEAMGRALAAAAARRGIPATSIDPRGRIVELGDGRYRKRIFGSTTSATPSIGAMIARDKHLANRYLHAAGLPVPESRLARTLGQALQAANDIGYPVVIKPLDQGNSAGVFLDLRSDDEVRARFDAAASISTSSKAIAVERYVLGRDYRATVVDGKVVAVSERVYPRVVGDGKRTIRELVDLENTNPRRGTRASSVYRKIAVDDEVLATLARQGRSLDDVPPRGDEIVLKKSGHRQDGALHVDVTERVHPANAALLRTATKVMGLDIAGIDLIATDIGQPILEAGGVIIELNANTAFNLQLFPAAGEARDPGPAIMEMLFPLGQPVRVPVAAVAADAESAMVCELVARLVVADGRAVGIATGRGVTIAGARYAEIDGRNPNGPRTVLNNPETEVAVVEVDPESILREGLGFGRCDVAVVLSCSGVKTPWGQPIEQVIVGALDAGGVAILNAAGGGDELLSTEAEISVMWVGLTSGDERIASLLEGGHGVVTSEGSAKDATLVVTVRQPGEQPIVVELPESCLGGMLRTAVEAAVAAAVGLGVSVETLSMMVALE